MTSSHLPENLALLERATQALVHTVRGLDDDAVRAPSLCDGWSRAHVIAHVSRNADGLANLAHWALTGERTPQYASAESRDADIEEGSARDAVHLLADLEASAARFAALAAQIPGRAEDAQIVARGGRPLHGRDLVTARLREVAFHHVDLDAGHTFAEEDPGLVERSLREAVGRLEAHDAPPSLLLRATEGGEWRIGAGDLLVTGPAGALLLWLARGRTTGLSSDGSLRALPAWG